MLSRTEGIVIRTHDYGESHKVVVLYTPQHGKVALMAYGAKKTKSRLGSVTQVLTYGQYVFYASKGMGTLKQGEAIQSHQTIREDILCLSYAAYIVELLDKLTIEKDPEPYLFHLLQKMLHFLEEGKDADILCRIFELKLLSAAGYRPQTERCVHCGAKEKRFFFSAAKGGFLCVDCRESDDKAVLLSPAAARLMRLFLHLDIDRLGDIRVKAATKEQLERAMHDYSDYHTDLLLKSRDFLKQMKRLGTS